MVLIFAGYWFDWTGFNGYNKVTIAHTISGTNAGTVTKSEEYQPGKALWDWLNLLGVLAIPAVVGLGAAWFTTKQAKVSEEASKQQRETELQIATDNQREAALQAYIDKMSELLLKEKLRDSAKEDEVRKIARIRTLTILHRLDVTRKRTVLQFLYESGLIDKNTSIIDLDGADLSKTNLSHANLKGADLRGAILRGTTLGGANLSEADLSKTDLWGADFNGVLGGFIDLSTIGGAKILVFDSYDGGIGANLRGANLSEAILYGSNAATEQLAQAKSLQGATMPDGTKHP